MRVAIAGSFLFLLNEVYGRDLGVYGDTYNITESDIRVEISNKLAGYRDSDKLKEFNERYRDAVTKQIKQPSRVVGITNATEDRRRVFDPTVELEEDIMIPKGSLDINQYQAKLKGIKEENTEYEILYKAGTKINPLRYMIPCQLCKHLLHNFNIRVFLCKFPHIFKISFTKPFHLWKC